MSNEDLAALRKFRKSKTNVRRIIIIILMILCFSLRNLLHGIIIILLSQQLAVCDIFFLLSCFSLFSNVVNWILFSSSFFYLVLLCSSEIYHALIYSDSIVLYSILSLNLLRLLYRKCLFHFNHSTAITHTIKFYVNLV